MDATPVRARVVALTGDLDKAERCRQIRSRLNDLSSLTQRGDDFSARLANAMVDAAAVAGARPVLLIASDTPR